jgi:hypothetical protein
VLATKKHPVEVGCVDRTPRIKRCVLGIVRANRRSEAGDAGIIHEDVDTPV